jgi:hypothetical protein
MVDFFTGLCQDGSKSDTVRRDVRFGLCDDPPLAGVSNPAYVNTSTPDKWIAKVDNKAGHEVTFKAVDNCIEILRLNGDPEKRCDGILLYDNKVVFVELKEKRDPSTKWVKEGGEQLKQTIKDFKHAHGKEGRILKAAYLANRKQPNFQQGHQTAINTFTSATKVLLRVEATIVLDQPGLGLRRGVLLRPRQRFPHASGGQWRMLRTGM